MAAATSVIPQFGRGVPFVDVSIIPVTFTFSTTAYATATGGIPVDLSILATSGALPFDFPTINPLDILGLFFLGLSTNGLLAQDLAVGTPTYTNPAGYPFAGGAASNYTPGGSDLGPQVRPSLQDLTIPSTFRLYGTGSAEYAGLHEIQDGNVTDTITVGIMVARNGPNS
jgi:hypothetical protein